MNEALALRKSLDLSQTQMAEFMGMPVGTWRSWEHGVRNPSGAGKKFMEFIGLVNMMNPQIVRAVISGLGE